MGKKRALVLAGGGGRGAFQAPIIDKLMSEGLEFHHVFGVSVGSINGAMASLKADNLTALWKDVKRSNVFGGPAAQYGIPGKAFQIFKILVGSENSIFENEALKKLLKRHYQPSSTKIPFTFGSTSLQTGKFHTFSISPNPDSEDLNYKFDEDKVIDYLVSSSTIPLLLPPVFDEFVDGGLKNMAPLGSAVEKGVDEIIMVPTEELFKEPRGYEKIYSPDIFGIGRSSLNIILDETLQNDYQITEKINELVKKAENKGIKLRKENGERYKCINIEVIQPDEHLGSAIDFSSDALKKRFQIGKREVNRFLESY